MIVLKLELHSANTGAITTLGSAIIHNISPRGTGPKKADYEIKVGHKSQAKSLNTIFNKPLRKGTVKNYPRLSYNVWRLVIRALLEAFPEEKKVKT